jgi:hypothetical protein
METRWTIIILFALVVIALILLLIKKNNKDKKSLFKKLPGDYPDPTNVESEFESEDPPTIP